MTYKDFGVKRLEGKLQNGIRVILFQRTSTPIYIRAVLKAGACYDPKGKEGLSHFLEHMLALGSKDFPSKDMLAEHIESVGGMYSLNTQNEVMCINTEVADANDVDYSIDILRSVLCEPLLDPQKFEKEKTAIFAEYGQVMSNPMNFLLTEVLRQAFKDTSFSYRPLGLLESIEKITYEDIQIHYKEFVNAENITIIAAGDIQLDLLVDKLNKLNIPTNKTLGKDLVYGPSIENCHIHIPHESKQIYTFFGYKGDKAFSVEALSLKILGIILGGGRNSRLLKHLRHDLGLIYNLQQIRLGNIQSSVYGITTNASSDNMSSILAETEAVFNDLAKNGVTEKELEFAKNKAIKSLKRNMQMSANWVEFHYYGETLLPDQYWTLDKYISMIQQLTLTDINLTARNFFSDKKKYIITIGQK